MSNKVLLGLTIPIIINIWYCIDTHNEINKLNKRIKDLEHRFKYF